MVGAFDGLLLHKTLRDKPKDAHRLCLTNTVVVVHGLQVDLQVPIDVVDHNCVGRGKVETILPARVLRRKQSFLLTGALNSSVWASRHLPMSPTKILVSFVGGRALDRSLFTILLLLLYLLSAAIMCFTASLVSSTTSFFLHATISLDISRKNILLNVVRIH